MPKEPFRQTRESLKAIFQKGKLPTEASFETLIDSTINIIDDGIGKSEKFGYELTPQGDSKSLLTFFKSLEQTDGAKWQFAIRGKEKEEGLSFGLLGKEDENGLSEKEKKPPTLFFDKDGNIGVQTIHPTMPLSVNGFIGMKGRIGTHKYNTVNGDGQYQTIIEGVKSPQAFEIVARIDGPKNRGKYAMTHAIAICTHPANRFNNWFNKIRQTNAFYGWPWNRIKLKWKKNDKALDLQIKTRSHYGKDKENNNEPYKIHFHITKLWDEQHISDLMNTKDINTETNKPAKTKA